MTPFADQFGQDGNISQDPLFCTAGLADFTISADSPCAPAHSQGCDLIGAWSVGCDWPLGVSLERAPRASLAPNVPNPFNPTTTLSYSLAAAGRVRLAIHSLDGRLVATLVDESRSAGQHTATWHGRDGNDRPLPSGKYLATLNAAGEQHVRSLVMLR